MPKIDVEALRAQMMGSLEEAAKDFNAVAPAEKAQVRAAAAQVELHVWLTVENEEHQTPGQDIATALASTVASAFGQCFEGLTEKEAMMIISHFCTRFANSFLAIIAEDGSVVSGPSVAVSGFRAQ